MRLNYHIAWIEEDPEFIRPQRERIENYLTELGFFPKIHIQRNGKNILKILEDNDFNLILMDEHLPAEDGEEDQGHELIDRIRNFDLYTEIIFYSGKINIAKDIEKKYEGVFYADRDTFFEKTRRIIDLTIKKQQDISNQRGLFIAEAIDIASNMEEIIIKVMIKEEKSNFFNNNVIREEFFTDIAKYKILQRLLKNNIAKQNVIINGKYMDDEKKTAEEIREKLQPLKVTLDSLEKEVIRVRNNLAHSKLSDDKKNTLVCKGEPKEFNKDTCIEVRKNFKKHLENLEKI